MRLLKKQTYKFIRGLKGALADSMISRTWVRLTEAKELSKLLDFETMPAKTFYKIQKNLQEIKKSQENLPKLPEDEVEEAAKKLYQKWQETMSLLGKAKSRAQQLRWRDITERYYREIDEDSFNIFVKKQKKDIAWECRMIRMQAGLNLASIGMKEGYDILEELGIKVDTFKRASQKVRAEITKKELRESKTQEDSNEVIDFYVLLAKARKAGYDIRGDITLLEWIGTLKSIKEDARNDS